MFVQTWITVSLWLSPAAEAKSYAESLASARNAMDLGDRDPRAAIGALTAALAELEDLTPKLASDKIGQRTQLRARLSLARSFLVSGDAEAAGLTMDEVIRSSADESLEDEVAKFGPTLTQLYHERLAVSERGGRGTLEVDCRIPCRVFVNERVSAPANEPLYLGTYRVWVESLDGRIAPLRTTVEIVDGVVVRVAFAPSDHAEGDEAAEPPKPEVIDASAVGPTPTSGVVSLDEGTIRRHYIQRWLEISGLIVGAGLLATGSTLLYLDGRCISEVQASGRCRGYVTAPAGYTTVAIGSVLAAVSTVTLAVHEVRFGRYRDQQVSLTWTHRF